MKHQISGIDLKILNQVSYKGFQEKHNFLFLNWHVEGLLLFLVCDNKNRQDTVI